MTNIRIGQGYDVHKLVSGRPLILGGVHIEHPLGLEGHSDADVLLHAVCDALLGAAALGDIGTHFPDSTAEYKNADSLELLKSVGTLIREAGYFIGNIDATLIVQKPKISPYRDEMRANIGRALNISIKKVSIKATTEEGLGFTGSEDGISATAVALIFT